MDLELLEQLLHEPESQSLDFKQAQYRFAGASDRDRSELLKDVLAFANSWRRTSAYVLIGVREVKGGRGQVVGISDHIEDASLQQFVNSKTQRRVELSYEVVRVEGVEIGVIEIPVQDRPFYALRDYGRVRRGVVYLRSGSSTREATPEDLVEMGAQQSRETAPSLVLSWADAEERVALPSPYAVDRVCLYPLLPPKTFDYAVRHRGFPYVVTAQPNSKYSEQLIEYCFQQAVCVQVGLVLSNESRTVARRVRFVGSVVGTVVEMPEYMASLPKREYDLLAGISDVKLPHGDEVEPMVQKIGDRWEVSVEFGDVRPRETIFTHGSVYLWSPLTEVVELQGVLYADNLGDPIACSLEIDLRVEQRPMKLDDALPYLDQ